ncbi:MAG: hypothetical protein H0V44_07605, partial [Planctomycetes bacterium]|nr:hypothetical protein [Planctomycetota bacterium]
MIRRPLLILCVVAALGGPSTWAHTELEVRIAEATAAIDAHPEDATLYLQRGDLYRQHACWDDALADFERARRLAPDLAVVDLDRALTLSDAGRDADALAAFDAFLARAPG